MYIISLYRLAKSTRAWGQDPPPSFSILLYTEGLGFLCKYFFSNIMQGMHKSD